MKYKDERGEELMLMFVANKSACMDTESLNVVVCTTSDLFWFSPTNHYML